MENNKKDRFETDELKDEEMTVELDLDDGLLFRSNEEGTRLRDCFV
mgnify:CR=1 FL=1